MFFVNFVTFSFRKLLLCYDSLENVAFIYAFKVYFLLAAKQSIFNIQNLLTYRVTS